MSPLSLYGLTFVLRRCSRLYVVRGFRSYASRYFSEVCRALTDAGWATTLLCLNSASTPCQPGQTTIWGKPHGNKVVDISVIVTPNAVIMLMGIGDRGQNRALKCVHAVGHLYGCTALFGARYRHSALGTPERPLRGDGAIVSWA